MSWQSTNAAWSRMGLKPLEKLVLLALADRADEAGFCFPSMEWISTRSGVCRRSVSRFVQRLESAGLLTVVKRYGDDGRRQSNAYQLLLGDSQSHGLSDSQSHGTRGLSVQKPCDSQSPIYKEIDPNRSIHRLSDSQSRGDLFESFWGAYPKKVGKAAALKAWRKNNLDGMADQICTDVESRAKEDFQWRDPKFIPNPATYINDERWTDEWRSAAPPSRPTGVVL